MTKELAACQSVTSAKSVAQCALRVLMVVPKYPAPVVGGLERQSRELATMLVRRGHEVAVASYRFVDNQRCFEIVDGVQVHRTRALLGKRTVSLAAAFELARMAWRFGRTFDVVHVHTISWLPTLAVVIAKLLRKPVLVKVPNTGTRGIAVLRRRPLDRIRLALLTCGDVFVSMNEEIREELKQIGIPATRVLAAPNGIDMRATVADARRKDDTVTVVFVGRLVPEKRPLDLIAAWKLLQGRCPRTASLRLIGDGPARSDLERSIERLGLTESVKLLGQRDDVLQLLGESDVFVLPSTNEGNSNAVLEAMRAGLPVIATNLSGTRLQVGPEGERFLVAPGDVEGLAERIEVLLLDEGLRCEVGRAMRNRVEAHFSIEEVAATYEAAYHLMVSGRRDQVSCLNNDRR